MAHNLVLDRMDHKILTLLQGDAGQNLETIGDTVGLSPSAVQRRIARYRANGIIRKEIAVLDSGKVAGLVLAAVFITFQQETPSLHKAFQDRMRNSSEVQQCYDLAGGKDYLVILAATAMSDYVGILDRLFVSDKNIQRYDTHFIFDTVKVSLAVPTACLDI